jgi:hypothetical protein
VRKKSVSQSGNGNAHAFFASSLCAVGVGLAIVSLAATPNERGTNPRADVTSVKAQVAALVTSSNFRQDVNANGIISNTDVSTTKARVGTQLP